LKHVNKNGTEVFVGNKDFDYCVRKFNKKVQKSGVLIKYAESRFYEKPTKKRARKKRESIMRIQKEERKALKDSLKLKKYKQDQTEERERSY
jgi:ribosomal protein S21